MATDGACDQKCKRAWLFGPCRHEPHSFVAGVDVVWIASGFQNRNNPTDGPYLVKELGSDGFWDLEYIGDDPEVGKRSPRARGGILTRVGPKT